MQPPPEKTVPQVVVQENGETKEKEKNEEDLVTAEAKKIVETLTGADSERHSAFCLFLLGWHEERFESDDQCLVN